MLRWWRRWMTRTQPARRARLKPPSAPTASPPPPTSSTRNKDQDDKKKKQKKKQKPPTGEPSSRPAAQVGGRPRARTCLFACPAAQRTAVVAALMWTLRGWPTGVGAGLSLGPRNPCASRRRPARKLPLRGWGSSCRTRWSNASQLRCKRPPLCRHPHPLRSAQLSQQRRRPATTTAASGP
jgi:hypothetical protein